MKKITPFILLSGLLCGSSFLSSCAVNGRSGSADALTREYMSFDSPAIKPQNKNNVRIKISTSNQALYVVEGSKVLLATPVTVGGQGATTPLGNYTVLKKDHKHRANTHGWAYNPGTGEYMLTKLSNKPWDLG